MRLRRMPQARVDLAEIVALIARDDPNAAERVYDRIFATAALLLEQRALGRPGCVDGTRELVVPNTPYVVPYRRRKGVVQLLAVIHSKRAFAAG